MLMHKKKLSNPKYLIYKTKKLLESDKANYLKNLLLQTIFYGLLINITFLATLNTNINITNILGFGITWHFISQEIPIVIDKYRSNKK